MKNKLTPTTDCTALVQRFVFIRGSGRQIFDLHEHSIVSKNDVIEICITQNIFDLWEKHPNKKFCNIIDVGYDSQNRYGLVCNLYDGTASSEVRLNNLIHHLISRGDE